MSYDAVREAAEIADSKMDTFREAMRLRAEKRVAMADLRDADKFDAQENETMELKSWSPFFQAIKSGQKTHDLRSKKDREFHVGQVLTLLEYDPFTGKYTGDEVAVEVTYITDDVTPCAFSSAVLDKGYCILSLRVVADDSSDIPF